MLAAMLSMSEGFSSSQHAHVCLNSVRSPEPSLQPCHRLHMLSDICCSVAWLSQRISSTSCRLSCISRLCGSAPTSVQRNSIFIDWLTLIKMKRWFRGWGFHTRIWYLYLVWSKKTQVMDGSGPKTEIQKTFPKCSTSASLIVQISIVAALCPVFFLVHFLSLVHQTAQLHLQGKQTAPQFSPGVLSAPAFG